MFVFEILNLKIKNLGLLILIFLISIVLFF